MKINQAPPRGFWFVTDELKAEIEDLVKKDPGVFRGPDVRIFNKFLPALGWYQPMRWGGVLLDRGLYAIRSRKVVHLRSLEHLS